MTQKPSPLRAGLFLIVCPARVGSSMLVNALQTHPALTCHMEIFNPARVEGFWGSYRTRLAEEPDLEARLRHLRERDPAAYLYKIAFDAQRRVQAGFKFKFDELLLPTFAGARTILTQDRDVKIIFLTRWNLLRRYVSHLRATQSGVTMRREGEPAAPVSALHIDANACIEDMEATGRRQNFVRAMFKGHEALSVTYEDLTGPHPHAAFGRVLEFLGVEAQPFRTAHAKLGQEALSAEIENLPELRQRFASTPFLPFLED